MDAIAPWIGNNDTPDPGSTGYYAAYYRVHWMGDEPDWGKWEYDDDDDGAGNDSDQVDMVELTICPYGS